jgi:hypothetical protein
MLASSMKRHLVFIAAGLIASGGTVSVARADDTDALISQLTTVVNSDKDSDPATKDAVIKLIATYRVYLRQLVALMNDAAGQQPSSAVQAGQDVSTAQGQPRQSLQTTGLQTGGLQTSHLQEVHLDGYPSLPAVDPVSSVSANTLTPQQIAYKAAQDREQKERQQFYFQHPGRFPQQE